MANKFSSLNKLVFFSVLSLFVFGFSVGEVYGAAYIKLGDIKGEATDSNHDKWIDVLSIDLHLEDADAKQIDLTKRLDFSSARISEAAITGEVIPKATVHICSETERVKCEEYQLTDVSFLRYFVSANGDDRPTEQVTLVYSEIKESSAQKPEVTPEPESPVDTTEPEKPVEIPDETSAEMQDQDTDAPRVPTWVETTATFWIDGNVSDREFTDGIGYLVKEGIIELDEKVESTAEDTSTEPEVPDWIKESTRWWVEGLVPEDQFLESIKWLIKNNVIRGV